MTKRHWLFIVIGLAVALVIGFLVGHKYDPDPPIESFYVAQVDSLVQVNALLQDSISGLRADTKTITKEIIKYRTLYDTIRISQNTNELIGNLKTIINTPIGQR